MQKKNTKTHTMPETIRSAAGSRALVGWALGDAALSRDVLFFQMCFLAAAAETAISKMIPGLIELDSIEHGRP
jgi:hypothetical protein